MYKPFINHITISLVIMMFFFGSVHIAVANGTPIWDIIENPYSNSDVRYRDVKFLNSTHGFVVGVTTEGIGGGVILSTIDSGDSWFERHHDANQAFRQISIVDQNVIWITGRGGLVYTTDGGLNWTNSTTIGSGTSGLGAISFVNETHGWTSTNKVLYTTSDSGATWEDVASWQYNDTARDFHISDSRIWLIGSYGIYYSSDFGSTWSQQFNRGGWSLSSTEGDIAWAVADNMLARSNDGVQWYSQVLPRISPFGGYYPPYFSDVLFLTSSIGWLAGLETPVSFTPNGGIDWYTQNTGTDGVRIYTLDFINQTHGWAAGSQGTIIRTTIGDSYTSRLWKGLTDYVIILPILAAFIGISSIFIFRKRYRNTKGPARPTQKLESIEPI
ncbi:MAG: YCF48-related protein [Candidatus Thorarchaeota archaeon]